VASHRTAAKQQIATKSRGRPFPKGRSGNPGGRPKDVAHIRDLAREYSSEAIKTLATIMRDPGEKSSARTRAAETLLDRAWGRVSACPEAGEPTHPQSPSEGMTDAEIDARIEQLLQIWQEDR